MRVLFVKDESSMLRGLDAKTKLSVMLVSAVLVVACSGVISQMVLFLFTLVYVLMLKRPKLVTLLYILMAVMMAVSAGFGWLISLWAPKLGGLSAQALFVPFLRGVSMMNVVMVLALTTRVAGNTGAFASALCCLFAGSSHASLHPDLHKRYSSGLGDASYPRLADGPRDDYDAPNPVGSPAVHADPLSRTQIL